MPGPAQFLPLIHILVPTTGIILEDGLDGIAIDLPALKVKPTHGELFPLNIQVKDPLWPLRNMFDFTFSVKPGEARTLWLDPRDRICRPEKACISRLPVRAAILTRRRSKAATLRLVFKPRAEARVEHELDRFTQLKDSYAMLVEEHPHSPKFNLWNRFEADLTDLLRVNPDHTLGRKYAALNWAGRICHFSSPSHLPAFRCGPSGRLNCLGA